MRSQMLTMARRRTRRLALAVVVAMPVGLLAVARPASAAPVSFVLGGAAGYEAQISIFGGVQPHDGPTPSVTLATDGTNSPQSGTAASGLVRHGPATFFTSDRLDVSTAGTPASGSVTTSTSVINVNKAATQPTLTGSEIITADRVQTTCTATSTGITASSTFTNATLQTDSGDTHTPSQPGDHPTVNVAIPVNPPASPQGANQTPPPQPPPPPTSVYPNGHIHVNGAVDYFHVVFNEQFTNPDGSLTVNAAHEFLDGPTAVGDLIIGHSVCGVSNTAHVPGVVNSLGAFAANASAVVNWSPSIANGGAAISSYTVSTNAPANGATHAPVVVPASSCNPNCSTTISGLSNSLAITGNGGYTFAVFATNSVGNGPPTTSSPVFPQVTLGEFIPVTPGRILDTRSGSTNFGTCTPAPCATLRGGAETATVKVAGQLAQTSGAALVPPAGANAVVMNVTIVNPTAASVLTVYPSTSAQPGVSNLNWVGGQAATPNLVTVALGTTAPGSVKVTNAFGSVDVIADVVGYYTDGSTTAGTRFNAVTPGRILDTRAATNWGNCIPSPCLTLGLGTSPQIYTVAVEGQQAQGGGTLVPQTGASAVVMNVTVVNPSTSSVLTVYPSTAAQPGTSNLNWSGGQGATPNLVTVAVGADGNVKIANAFGSVDVIADVVGWYGPAGSVTGDRFTALVPGRILDSRAPAFGTCTPAPCATLGAGTNPETYTVKVAGQAAQGGGALVPATGASAVVMNVTIVNPNSGSFLTVYPSNAAQPGTSNLNWAAAQAATPNLVGVGLGTDGSVKIANNNGTVDVIADVAGWFNDGTS